ncbi:TPA: hypothetical protein PXM11_003584 [Yersinia enterocolitica]|uniref:Uncharacterized protein n=2 Tax=Yersiniaceae TaxID=1903411 RepID=A0ABM9SIH5_YEREN|nr:hypothetical protein [Yersinia enterocolitica]CFV26366.1 Uncharacterised protein [Yersinia enterocolitica]CNE67600.1 Uncharacterised protein [Yersinia enterocolitica]CQD73614.1 Uncharacterised protein [Yersinia enterocolitica]CRX94434.1 Uncharacterised protein [Yersinia enterocolitica]HDL6976214.1 hypothetical protein [Yersinia enterocolitica]
MMDRMDSIAEQLAGDRLSLQKSQVEAQPSGTITIDKELFKQLLQLAFNNPNFASQITNIDVDLTSAFANEVTMRFKPSDFLLRLGAALRACG